MGQASGFSENQRKTLCVTIPFTHACTSVQCTRGRNASEPTIVVQASMHGQKRVSLLFGDGLRRSSQRLLYSCCSPKQMIAAFAAARSPGTGRSDGSLHMDGMSARYYQ